MKMPPSFCALLLAASLQAAPGAPLTLYVSEGGDNRIAIYAMDPATGDLTRTGSRDLPGAPGSLALSPDRKHLYAAVRSTKEFATLAVDPKTGSLGEPVLVPAGFNPVYVRPDRTGRWLLSASYSEGVAAVSAITNGLIQGAPLVTLPTGKKAHCIQTDPTNRFAFVPHAGELNKIEQLRFDADSGALTHNSPPHVIAGPGEGPRHMQFHPNGRWVYSINEQAKSVALWHYDPAVGTLKSRQAAPTVPPDWDPAKGTCADLHLSADGRFAYASTRGHDSLAVFSIDPQTGALTSQGQTPTEKTPRSFCLTPGGENFVVSAGEGSHRLAVYRRNKDTGALTPIKTHNCGKGPSWVLGAQFE